MRYTTNTQITAALIYCFIASFAFHTNAFSADISPELGIWISKEELMSLPTSGSAWNSVVSAAESNWGSTCLDDNDCQHDVRTLAGALVAARLNDTSMRNKTVAGLQSAMQSNLSRTLELGRGLQSYVIAADIIGYHAPEFVQWVTEVISDESIPGNRGDGLLATAYMAGNNWGSHARAAVVASALYLDDQTILNKVVNAYKGFIGYRNVPNTMIYQPTNWHAESDKAGVNRMGTTINGVSVSGVLPPDWMRSAEFQWLPEETVYMWEGMQGFVVTAVLLHRAGLVDC